MRRISLSLVLLALLLTRAQVIDASFAPEIPYAAQATIRDEYLEWVHLPRMGGPCREQPVAQVTWIRPEAVIGIRPVVWMREDARWGAILGLEGLQVPSVGTSLFVQPVLVLPDVSIYRTCQPSEVDVDKVSEEVGRVSLVA